MIRDDDRLVFLQREVSKYEKLANDSSRYNLKQNENVYRRIAEESKANLMVEMAKYLKK